MAHLRIKLVLQGELFCRTNDFGQAHSAESFMNMQQTFQGAGNGNGTKADIEILGGSAKINGYFEKISSREKPWSYP